MLVAISFAVIAITEWLLTSNKTKHDKQLFWWLFSLFVVWNLAANFIPWWPQPNNLITMIFGWVK